MIYVETSYYGVSFLCVTIPYILVLSVLCRGCQCTTQWCTSAPPPVTENSVFQTQKQLLCPFVKKQKETHLTSLFVFSSYSFI